MKLLPLLAGGLAMLALLAPAASQDSGVQPTYGLVRLANGFHPDPHTVNLQAGGRVDASRLGAGCRGMIAEASDVGLVFDAGSLPLNLYVRSRADTTLVVKAPDGRWYCSDDAIGLNPVVSFDTPQSGRYDIWIGSFHGVPSATLMVSELPAR